MKKFVCLICSIILAFSSLYLFGCGNGAKCTHVPTEEITYELDGDYAVISYKCSLCGKGSDSVIEKVKVDAVIDGDNNAVAKAQNTLKGDIVIFLKAGLYEKIYFVTRMGATRLLCEDGVQIQNAQFSGGIDTATLENAFLKSEPWENASIIKFEEAAGERTWLNVTIKNCRFEGNAFIDSAWKDGIAENLTVENCKFKNTTDNYDGELKGSARSAIFIDEVWGKTHIKDCVFDGFEWSAIRFGRVSVEGETIIENCYFAGRTRGDEGYSIYIQIQNSKLPNPEYSLTIRNCIFDDVRPLGLSRSITMPYPNIIIGPNTWRVFPHENEKIYWWQTDNPNTVYNPSEQTLLG